MRLSLFSPSTIGVIGVVGLVAALSLGGPQAAHAQTTVTYNNLGTFTQTGPLQNGGITVTSPGTISVQADGNGLIRGLAVQGGLTNSGNDLIDNGETALFTFDNGPVTQVTIKSSGFAANGNTTPSFVEAFGAGNSSLGVFNYSFTTNLSSLVGGAGISAFRITGGTNQGYNVWSVTYTPAAITGAVPEPAEWLAMGMAGTSVCGLMVRARRRKAVKSNTAA
ncbi:MAG: PEP-CTERM sorting domain-containing protein [Armatimonadota bacterium]